jgi:glutamate-1-semialdehyde 2,1-aminomutase
LIQIADGGAAIVDAYRKRTGRSQAAMDRATAVMPGGNTRTTTFNPPYPVMYAAGNGPWLTDVDGHRYADLHYNGLSIIHGHAYKPVVDAIASVLPNGTAWSGASEKQIAFAQHLTTRVPGERYARFTNSGSEAGMLAVQVARRVTGRPLILKFRNAYHGSYPDLEAGLYGLGEKPGRALLANFNDLQSCAEAFQRNRDQIAAVIYEPVMFTGRVSVAAQGFLNELENLARRHGALTILDDCLMLRLAPAGSIEKFGLDPDLIVLGKFIGGGTSLGAVLGRRDIMACLDPRNAGCMFHGGSFNGNVLGCTAGLAALQNLDGAAIAHMDDQCARLRQAMVEAAAPTRIAITVSGAGSVGGIAFDDDQSRHEENPSDVGLAALFHLACLNEGVAMGPGGLFALATTVDETALTHIIKGVGAALSALDSIVARDT